MNDLCYCKGDKNIKYQPWSSRVDTAVELSLFIELGEVPTPELGREATVGTDPEGVTRAEGEFAIKFSLTLAHPASKIEPRDILGTSHVLEA